MGYSIGEPRQVTASWKEEDMAWRFMSLWGLALWARCTGCSEGEWAGWANGFSGEGALQRWVQTGLLRKDEKSARARHMPDSSWTSINMLTIGRRVLPH